MEEAAKSMGLTLPEDLEEKLPERSAAEQADKSLPAWWFDPDEPPRLLEEEEEEILSVPARKSEGTGGGGRRGFDAEDYRKAIDEEGSIAGAARRLDVNESTVREQCIRHEIEVPSVGGVPGE